MQILFWVPVVGMWARALFGYCLMARTMSLMPWNRQVPFTGELLMKTYFSSTSPWQLHAGSSTLGANGGKRLKPRKPVPQGGHMNQETLYARLGGYDAIAAVGNDLIVRGRPP